MFSYNIMFALSLLCFSTRKKKKVDDPSAWKFVQAYRGTYGIATGLSASAAQG